MKRILKLPNYHWIIVFCICGGFAVALAYTSYNLFHLSMANLKFIQQFGALAVMEGALVQTIEILIGAGFSLAFYIGFKLCEAELVTRYSCWKSQ
jgi:hypothetical protein